MRTLTIVSSCSAVSTDHGTIVIRASMQHRRDFGFARLPSDDP